MVEIPLFGRVKGRTLEFVVLEGKVKLKFQSEDFARLFLRRFHKLLTESQDDLPRLPIGRVCEWDSVIATCRFVPRRTSREFDVPPSRVAQIMILSLGRRRRPFFILVTEREYIRLKESIALLASGS